MIRTIDGLQFGVGRDDDAGFEPAVSGYGRLVESDRSIEERLPHLLTWTW